MHTDNDKTNHKLEKDMQTGEKICDNLYTMLNIQNTQNYSLKEKKKNMRDQ